MEMEGEGVFQTLHKLGVSKKQVVNEAKKIGRKAIPIATGALGAMLGAETGNPMLTEELGRNLGQQLSKQYLGGSIKLRKHMDGEGVYQTLHKLGIKKKDAVKIGSKVVDKASSLAGKAITQYTGNKQAGDAFEKLSKSSAKKLLETGSVKQAIKSGKASAQDIAHSAIKDYAEQHLPMDVSSAVHSVVEQIPEATEIYPAEVEVMNDGVDKMGSGFRKRVHRGGALPYTSMPYQKSMKRIMVGGMMPMMGGMVRPMSDMQTLSPYASTHSPQMSPFVPHHNPYKTGFKVGGSFLPAGSTHGGSFLPA